MPHSVMSTRARDLLVLFFQRSSLFCNTKGNNIDNNVSVVVSKDISNTASSLLELRPVRHQAALFESCKKLMALLVLGLLFHRQPNNINSILKYRKRFCTGP